MTEHKDGVPSEEAFKDPSRRRSRPKFGVYAKSMGENNGCLYYRVEVPTRGLFKLGLAEAFVDAGRGAVDESIGALFSAEIILNFALSGGSVEAVLNALSNMRSGKTDDGNEVIFPPSFVFDLDDRIDYTHPFNPAFVHLGVRAYDGTPLKNGDRLVTTFPDGTDVILWEDGVTRHEVQHEVVTFDVERNWRRVNQVFDTARRADGVTVPSPALAEFYRELGAKDVYIFPNSVIPEDYPAPQLVPRPEGAVRIMWQGGASHMVDWFPLRDAVRTIALKYPKVKFVIWGTHYPWIHDNIPKEQLELKSWVPYDAYKPMRGIVDVDINLCPLVDNVFNKGKSAIKWYESVLPFEPEATLAAKAAPYSDEIEDGKTGLLYSSPEEFVEKLSALIENVQLRKTLAREARSWVIANRHYEKTVPGLFEFYQHLRARKRVALAA